MKKIIRLTESDLIKLVKRVVNEETTNLPKSKCNFPVDACVEDVNYDKLTYDIAYGVAEACGCLKGGVSYYLQTWDNLKLLTNLRKINSRKIFEEVNDLVGCLMRVQGWRSELDPYPLAKLVNSISIDSAQDKLEIKEMKSILSKFKSLR